MPSIPPMPALTVRQPWASLIALGLKRVETRSWSTPYRGPLAIHAGTSLTGFGRNGTFTDVGPWTVERTRGSLLLRGPGLAWPYRLPLGCVIATAQLHDVQRTTDPRLAETVDDVEASVGDYAPGRYGWRLASVHPIPNPPITPGALGLWPWPGIPEPTEVPA